MYTKSIIKIAFILLVIENKHYNTFLFAVSIQQIRIYII